MAALLDLPLREWSWEEDASRSTLVDGNMEAVGTAAWTVYSGATLSKETAAPSAGKSLRITQAGVQSGTYQSLVLTAVGTPYRLIGRGRSDGTAVWAVGDGGSVDRWVVGTNGVAWQDYDIKVVSANTSLFLIKRAAGTWVEFDDIQAIPFIARTKNFGLLGGSTQLGDGLTASRFPTFIGQMRPGCTFNAGDTQYLSFPGVSPMGTSGTAICLVQFSPTTIGEVNSHVLMSQAPTAGVYGTGWLLNQYGSDIYAYWRAAGSTVIAPGLSPGIHSVAMTNDGALVRVYIDGILTGVPAAPGGASVQSGVTIGGSTDGVMPSIHNSTVFAASVYQNALTATQVRSWHERQMSLISMR